MKTIPFEHTLSEEEIAYLQTLIGRTLSGIGSDAIFIEPSHPGKWAFYAWIELSTWGDNLVKRLEYDFDETYGGNDFIELRIKLFDRNRVTLNAHIHFSDDLLTIQKIETYGYDSEYIIKNICGDIPKFSLKDKEKYNEKMAIENTILIYGTNGRRLWIECLEPISKIIVTMDEGYIEERLRLSNPDCNAKMNLKRTIV